MRVRPPCHPPAPPRVPYSPGLLQRCHQRRRGHLGQVGRTQLGGSPGARHGESPGVAQGPRGSWGRSPEEEEEQQPWESSAPLLRLGIFPRLPTPPNKGAALKSRGFGTKEGMGRPRAERAQPRPCPIARSIPHPPNPGNAAFPTPGPQRGSFTPANTKKAANSTKYFLRAGRGAGSFYPPPNPTRNVGVTPPLKSPAAFLPIKPAPSSEVSSPPSPRLFFFLI